MLINVSEKVDPLSFKLVRMSLSELDGEISTGAATEVMVDELVTGIKVMVEVELVAGATTTGCGVGSGAADLGVERLAEKVLCE